MKEKANYPKKKKNNKNNKKIDLFLAFRRKAKRVKDNFGLKNASSYIRPFGPIFLTEY